MHLIRHVLLISLVFGLGACSNKGLRELSRPADGPDEFLVVPGKPLEPPKSYSELPAPTPGGENRSDQTPLEDSVASLGGRRQAATGAIPAADGALVNRASRFGRSADIRAVTAAEDAAFRKRRGRFTAIKLPGVDRYKDVYRRQALNPHKEQSRWRRAGAATPTTPPRN